MDEGSPICLQDERCPGRTPTLVDRLRATPNWRRESFEHWKTATSVYDRAPFEAADELERLRAALSSVLASDVGRQTLHKLADGQGTDTDDGRAWLSAARVLGPNAELTGRHASGGPVE